MAEHDPYAALRYADYRRLLAGTMLSSIGRQALNVAVGWELYQRTRWPAALGYVGLVQFLPVILLTLPAGHAADRLDRKRLLGASQALVGCAALGLAAISYLQGPIVLMYLCLLLTGIGQAFNMPTRWALISQVVPASQLANAVTWNSSIIQISFVVGPALGGLAIADERAAGAYLLAAALALVSAALILGIRPQPSDRPREPMSLPSLLAGLAFVHRSKLILATITLDLFAVLFGGATALLPIFARDILQVGPIGLGWLGAAPALGAIAMALILAHGVAMRRAGWTLLWAVSGFGVATVIFGLSENFWLSFFMLALTGALDNISVVVRGTLVQVLAPESMRGRVSAVNALFISSSNQLGAFESGITADWFGPVWSVVGGGIATLVVVVVAALVWPELLRLGALHDVKPAEEPEPASEEAKEVPSGTITSDASGHSSAEDHSP
jgi:MFS family permease